jgi:hypothetical protein
MWVLLRSILVTSRHAGESGQLLARALVTQGQSIDLSTKQNRFPTVRVPHPQK